MHKATKTSYLIPALFLLLLTLPFHAHAQSITLVDNGIETRMEKEQTQTEVKPGWKIVDIQLKSKLQRYLWGAHSQVYSDSREPQFLVTTDTLLLSNLVLIRMVPKAQYRKIRKPVVQDNEPLFVDLTSFSIQPYKDQEDAFLIQPTTPLAPGEYLFTWFGAPCIGKFEDWNVWTFTIK